jgi:hypothetical protein
MSDLKVLCDGNFKNGLPLNDLIRMVKFNHPDVIFLPYDNSRADVILSIDGFPNNFNSDIRKVIYMGSLNKFNENLTISHRRNDEYLQNIDHVFFNSNYYKNIMCSKYKFKKCSVLYPFGGIPADDNLQPVEHREPITGTLHFVSMAKWYKRIYKRINQVVKLYDDYIIREYPDSYLHIIGSGKETFTKSEGRVIYYKKDFHCLEYIDIMKKSHIHIIPTPFDTGPKTLNESLHYRVPFICSDNCAGKEYIDILGSCGISIGTDKFIKDYDSYSHYRPVERSKFYNREINYEKYFIAVKEILNNFNKYTSWKWNDKLNYKKQSDDLYNILKG